MKRNSLEAIIDSAQQAVDLAKALLKQPIYEQDIEELRNLGVEIENYAEDLPIQAK